MNGSPSFGAKMFPPWIDSSYMHGIGVLPLVLLIQSKSLYGNFVKDSKQGHPFQEYDSLLRGFVDPFRAHLDDRNHPHR